MTPMIVLLALHGVAVVWLLILIYVVRRENL